MKTFFTWLVCQGIFARILFGLAFEFAPKDTNILFSALLFAMIISVAEMIASAIVVYPLIEASANRR